mgnify:FL=1
MKLKISILSWIYFFLFSLSLFAQPANDNCSGAQNLGTLPTPGACAGGVQNGTTINFNNLTTVGATSNNPYTYQTNCSGSSSIMAAPALDVWYSFVSTGTVFNLSISGFANANVAIWYGNNCNTLNPWGCMIANGSGSGSMTLTQMTMGQTYYIEVSGNNATTTDNNFSLTLDNPFVFQSVDH